MAAEPAYAYAGNNPITATDPTGLYILRGVCENWDFTKAYAEAEFKTALCGNNRAWTERHPSAAKEAKETLAKALFHEALHLCRAQGVMGDEVEDHPGRRSTGYWSSLFTYDSPFNTDAEDYTDKC